MVNEENCYSCYCRIACYYIKCIANAQGVNVLGKDQTYWVAIEEKKRAEQENCAEVFRLRDGGSD